MVLSFKKKKPAPVFSFLPFLSLLMVLLSGVAKVAAQKNLMITPRRAVFESPQKTKELNLANTGKDTARYLISMMEIRMKEDGTFERIITPDAGQNFASNYLRFFPHSVVLSPGEAQTIKIQVTNPNQLTSGEYQSHIYCRAMPSESPLGEKTGTKDTGGVSVQLTSVFGISIPAIIRSGESTATVALSNAPLEMTKDDIPILNMTFDRKGNMSVYGDLSINFTSPQGKTTQVANIKGIAVCTPTTNRSVRVALDKTPGINYKAGTLHIVYTTPSDTKIMKLAETSIAL